MTETPEPRTFTDEQLRKWAEHQCSGVIINGKCFWTQAPTTVCRDFSDLARALFAARKETAEAVPRNVKYARAALDHGRCIACDMPCDEREYHPYAACLMFRACGSIQSVRANLNAVVDHGYEIAATPAERERDRADRAEAKLQRVRDWLKFAANSEGGIVAEIDRVLAREALGETDA